ncbi:hypothetical protein Cs7R123_56540 [Catellatospora sp. TT07R-123]|uniref:serpin family protein n=1 Tax=Catellatospora sp. TT07R-123 TaxID=2733863 RepID=UPI001B053DFF|nr:serpin family protein [Catellatospora sp. TT07R-123]GHJ48312.1 hypothetical protein Cs7R123_56540 [Catellatospora sp. TT07R-123]
MIEKAVAGANTLTARWAETFSADASAAVSGAGVWPLLAYLASAADGDGRAELAAAVGLPAEDAPEAATALLGLLRAAPALRAALGVWFHPDVPVREQWLRTVPAGSIGVLTDGALAAWTREQVGDLLECPPAPDGPEELLVLATVLTVRTTWKEPFEHDVISGQQGPWARRRLAGLKRASADRDQLAVYDTAAGRISVLSVEGSDDITVDILLGAEDAPAGAVLAAGISAPATLTPVRLGSQLTAQDQAPGVSIGHYHRTAEPQLFSYLPRFDVDSAPDLLAFADLFGLRTVSDRSRQRFPGMSESPLAVGAAKQSLTASFTALGFEAAVATRVSLAGGSFSPTVPPNVCFTVERPFGFAARHRPTGLVLVAGWVADGVDYVTPPEDLVDMSFLELRT